MVLTCGKKKVSLIFALMQRKIKLKLTSSNKLSFRKKSKNFFAPSAGKKCVCRINGGKVEISAENK